MEPLNISYPDWLRGVHHDGSLVSQLYPQLGDGVTLRLHTPVGAPVERIYLRTFPDGEQQLTPLKKVEKRDGVQWWQVSLPISEPQMHYRFVLQGQDGIWWYTAKGPQLQEPLDIFDFRIIAGYTAPSWLHASVFYQIFPDRFANGDPTNDPQPFEYTVRDGRPRTFVWESAPHDKTPPYLVFYGGDLDGVITHLDYLADLGVNAIYFNPLFTADSNHKYDVADYEQIDPHFGGNEALIRLREALDRRNMRYILDIVPNHCGVRNHWFRRAQSDPHSAEAQFFTFYNHPDEYATWLGVWSLPKLNYRSPLLRERMYAAVDSVFRRWLRPPYSADGWRVDVANMLARQGETQLGTQISRELRHAVKQESPDSYLLGENFFDATPQLQGDQYDGVMNYAGFANPLLHWLAGYQLKAWGMRRIIRTEIPYSTSALVRTMRERLAVVPWQIALQQLNLLGSHDTPRVRSLVDGNDRLHRLAVAVLFTFPGVPCIYYGDEIGMRDDPHLGQRGTMIWQPERWNHDLRAYHQKLIRLRRSLPALQTGGFRFLAAGENYFAYLRSSAQQQVVVIANRGSELSGVTINTQATPLIDGMTLRDAHDNTKFRVVDGRLSFVTLAQGARVLLSAS